MIISKNFQDTGVAVYEILPATQIEVLLTSSPQTIKIMNKPEICGVDFQHLLFDSLVDISNGIYRANTKITDFVKSDPPIDILYILRGGLNFDLHKALRKVTNKDAEVSFISSQRVESGQGFEIGEAGYQKWSIQNASLLCLGDISATGTTITHAIDRAVQQYTAEQKKPKWLLIFTIGTQRLINTALKIHERLSKMWFPDFEGTTLVFLEQIFNLYEGGGPLAYNHLAFTDFFRQLYPSAIEFEAHSLHNPVCFLERCAIYDGGSRAFEPKTYTNNLLRYWRSIVEHKPLISTTDALNLKTNLGEYQLGFDDWMKKRDWWNDVDNDVLQNLHRQGREAYEMLAATSMLEIAHTRLQEIEANRTAR